MPGRVLHDGANWCDGVQRLGILPDRCYATVSMFCKIILLHRKAKKQIMVSENCLEAEPE